LKNLITGEISRVETDYKNADSTLKKAIELINNTTIDSKVNSLKSELTKKYDNEISTVKNTITNNQDNIINT